ncbi:alanyl-tRNA editing protein AlaXM [Acidianus ambivalens]|uniref:Alanyl-tRNA editing protein AlaX n=1 Tax=Acidianus ambivalens TaxID=2283 RepID=A0A650CY18_ACIAM|nr:alanyl-tRNA editing protein AlaXM [Acidianus ambivalens]MQL54976.1 alanyl-tRNA editing protein AlaX [Acidianus ambivalens]QGR22759.1 alanyl-tRNA editing protein AlaX [Acidianus ambivalens]
MATEELYLKDSYIKEFEAKVTKVNGNEVILDKTAFYPGGGGLENDVGKLIKNNGEVLNVKEVKRQGDDIVHIIEGGELREGDNVKGVIDWDRRYKMMRLHTASHVMAAVAYSQFNALITGGHISPEYAKDDFNLENKDLIPQIVEKANEILSKGIEVKVYFLPREEALKIPGIVKLAERNPPSIPIWRIVEIPGIDIQADGGPHVKNTSEVGKIRIIKIENRGKNRKRVYYTVES